MENGDTSRDIKRAKIRLLIRAVFFFAIFPAFLICLGVASQYWQGWVYYGVITVPAFIVMVYLCRHDPALLMRRLKSREKDKSQRLLVGLLKYISLAGLVVVGLDYRFQWSHVPAGITITADIFAFLGYMIIFLVFRENTYASRTLNVEEGQKVISTGPYAIVRHPMYSGASLFYLVTPLALGSFWAVILFTLLPLLLVFRILREEKMLCKELPGYLEYCQKTRYRLIPFIW